MAGSFFDFDTALPAGVDDDPGHGLDEEEEEYDALNDETFGTAIEDDWEQDHEELAKLTENSRGWKDDFNESNHKDHDDLRNGQNNLEASLSQLVLEDNEDIGVRKKPSSAHLSHSSIAPYPDSPNALRNSVWAVGKHDGPLSTSSPLRPRVLPQGVKNVCTVEELERNLIQMRSGGVGSSSLPPPPGLGTPGGALRLEDLERKMTQTATQPRLDVPRFPPGLGRGNIYNNLQNQRLMGHPVHLEAPKVPLQQLPLGFNGSNVPPHLPFRQQNTFQPIHPGPGVLQLGPHPPQHLHYNMNGPRMPYHMNNHLPHPPHHQHNHHNQHLSNPVHYQQHRNPHHQFHFQHHQQHHQHHRVNGAGDYDEYAGLMTPWQKQWLLNIQTLQLNVGVPYVVDYYYTVYKNRKEKLSAEPQKTGEQHSVVRPASVKLGKDRPESTKPGRERAPSVMGPSKAYTPLQFENSLGKLQCVSVTAPRKLIDMEIVSSEGQEGQSTQRDIKKTKQLLLEIERLYVLLLELEDAFDPQAIEASAEAAAARALRDPPEREPEPEKPSPEELIQRMSSVLLQADKIFGFMGIRKGKTFLLRLLPHVPADAGLHHIFWGQVLVGLSIIVRRDQADNLLPRFLPELERWLKVCSLPQIIKLTTSLVAEASSKPKSNRSALATAVNGKFGLLVLAAIFSTVEHYLPQMNEEQKNQWGQFVATVAEVADTVLKLHGNHDSPFEQASGITAETVQRHVEFSVHDKTRIHDVLTVLLRLFFGDSLRPSNSIKPGEKSRESCETAHHSLIK